MSCVSQPASEESTIHSRIKSWSAGVRPLTLIRIHSLTHRAVRTQEEWLGTCREEEHLQCLFVCQFLCTCEECGVLMAGMMARAHGRAHGRAD